MAPPRPSVESKSRFGYVLGGDGDLLGFSYRSQVRTFLSWCGVSGERVGREKVGHDAINLASHHELRRVERCVPMSATALGEPPLACSSLQFQSVA